MPTLSLWIWSVGGDGISLPTPSFSLVHPVDQKHSGPKLLSYCWPSLWFCSCLCSPLYLWYQQQKTQDKKPSQEDTSANTAQCNFPHVSVMLDCLKNSWQKKYLNHIIYKIGNLMTKQFSHDFFSANNIYYSKHCKVRVERLNKRMLASRKR